MSDLDLSKYEGHTPGPWEVNKLPHQTMYACDTFVEPAVAAVWANGPDAELIADAPLLLEKVKECEAEHPPEEAYVEWCEAGKPDVLALRQSHARLLAAAKNADCCCGARECEGLRAAVAEAEALHGE